MRRSREAVQAQVDEARAELARLEAKLAAIQPDELTIKNDAGTGSAAFQFQDYGCREFLLHAGRSTSDYIGYFPAAAAGELRDWLNYHFPKENA